MVNKTRLRKMVNKSRLRKMVNKSRLRKMVNKSRFVKVKFKISQNKTQDLNFPSLKQSFTQSENFAVPFSSEASLFLF